LLNNSEVLNATTMRSPKRMIVYGVTKIETESRSVDLRWKHRGSNFRTIVFMPSMRANFRSFYLVLDLLKHLQSFKTDLSFKPNTSGRRRGSVHQMKYKHYGRRLRRSKMWLVDKKGRRVVVDNAFHVNPMLHLVSSKLPGQQCSAAAYRSSGGVLQQAGGLLKPRVCPEIAHVPSWPGKETNSLSADQVFGRKLISN
jgi:hypothetical protein